MNQVTARLKATACPDKSLALTNRLYCNDADAARLSPESPNDFFLELYGFIYSVSPHPAVAVGALGFNAIQRKLCQISLNADVSVTVFNPPKDGFMISDITFAVDYPTKAVKDKDPVDAVELAAHVKNTLAKQVISVGQDMVIDFQGTSLKLVCEEISVHKLAALVGAEDADSDGTTAARRGLVIPQSNVAVSKGGGSTLNLVNTQKSTTPSRIFRPDFSFEAMGIGGLDKEFSDIFRRAFASRVFPPAVVQKLGINHVRGMLLFGPPGCGKTLIARQIGKMLNGREPKVVNGPEVLNKYVGASEENIRKLFADAEVEYKERGDDSELHIIIFDELDAICKQRGSRGDSTGVNDQIVNQLLSKIDGVDSLNNVLLIGMTNRKDLMDEALLRPGRLEVHCEIGLPDEPGRLQIFRIHTAKMKQSNHMEPDVDIGELAQLTKNFSGAEIEGLCKSAASFALERNIDANNLAKPMDADAIKISWADFMSALAEVKPAFGAAANDFEQAIPNGIINYGSRHAVLTQTGNMLIDQVRNSANTPIMSVLLEGPIASGKTALAASLAKHSEFPFVKLISAESLIGYSELQKSAKITKMFDDAHKSAFSLIVLDDIERLLEYVRIGPRFSNVILQTLLVLVKKPPPKGRKLMVIGTTSCAPVLESMELLSSFNVVLNVPNLDGDASRSVMRQTKMVADADIERAVGELSRLDDGIGIKRLLMVLEMARQGKDTVTAESFSECLHNTGL